MRQDKPWPGSRHSGFLSYACHRVALAKLPVLSGSQHPICQMEGHISVEFLEEPLGLIPG